MKRSKKLITGVTTAFLLSAMSMNVFAASAYHTPAEAAAEITGKTVNEVVTERQTGKTYGTIAADAGKLEEFKRAMLELNRNSLNAQVASEMLTQTQADTILAAIAARQSICDSTGNGGRNGSAAGFGCGNGRGSGFGCGNGRGSGFCINN